ncbi:MAG: hypothetical protein CMP38_04555 [Rickettsiales bacterium]|nr:hypothetical protein [Rickettsiales bacterium]|tara:strand:+ start:235 stop:633 length:399 start_codon:yes stop_codon:yes gene_type:complete
MSLLKLYNKSKKSINKSSINSKYAISFKAYELLKRYVIQNMVQPEKLDNAYPKNTKFKVIKNVSQRSMQTFYKLSDKYQTNKSGVLSQFNSFKGKRQKRKLSKNAKDLLFKIKNDLPRYETIDYLIKNLKTK